MFDLTIFPLSLDSGREQHELPGLLVLAAPHKAARMRAQDHLLIYCRFQTTAIGGNASAALTPAQQQEILAKLAETYFGFSGSVTAGLRAVAARLNDFLLNRNLRAAQEGQTVGMLNIAALHGDGLIVAHAGLAHTFVLTKSQVEHFDDGLSPRSGSGAGRGLGLARQAIPRFYQAALTSGDLMVLCAEPPPSWNEKSLANSPQLTFEHLRRRLLSNAADDLQAAVIRFQTGKGQVNFWRPGDAAAPRPAQGRAARTPAPRPEPAATSGGGSGLPPVDVPVPGAQEPSPAAPADPTALNQEAHAGVPDLPTAPEAPVQGEPAPTETAPLDFAAASPDSILSQAPASETPPTGDAPALSDPQPPAVELPSDLAPGLGELDQPVSNTHERPGVYLGGVSAARETPSTPLPRPAQPSARSVPPSVVQPSETTESEVVSGSLRNDNTRSDRLRRAGSGALAGHTPTNGAASHAAKPKASRLKPERPPRPPDEPFGQVLRRTLAPAWLRFRSARSSAGVSMTKAASALPKRRDAQGQEVPFFNIPASAMLAIALIIPLVVATAAATVYFRNGREQQYQAYFLQAQQAAQQAAQLTDPIQQRQGWSRVYELAHKAETFQRTDTSHSLSQQAIANLDNLEGFVRLDYQPAVSGGFAADVKISRMVATLNDVYLLDTGEGRILRLYRTSTGYDVDPKFICGGTAGKVGAAVVGPLIDMVGLQPNNPSRSNIMGIDASGNLVFCPPGATGYNSRPLPLPDAGWGKLTGMTIFNDVLFVLDPKANAVYYYLPNSDGDYADPPHLYFDNNIPKMDDVIDLAVDQEDLYLLHSSGQMTICEAAGLGYASTKCTDPSPYGDTRAGYEPSPLFFAGSQFNQILTTEPPDPSLYALDAKNKSIYHLSLRRLNLQRQYRAQVDTDFPFPSSAPTAFTIAPNRRALMAFGNQVFFAPIP